MKPVVMTVVYLLTLALMHRWLPEPYAAPLLVLIMGLIYYWIPPRPDVSYGRWAIRVVQWAIIAFIGMALYLLISKPPASIPR